MNQSAVDGKSSRLDWLILLPLIFLPRVFNLGVFLTPDEPLFLAHARGFAAGLRSGDFSQTLGIGYPGVTVAGWSAPFVSPGGDQLAVYAGGRLVTALMTGALLLVLYRLARSLLGRWPALLGVSLLAVDPYTLSYSRLLHIAGPLALFMTLTGVAWLLWLRDKRQLWLGLTGLFCGLALLTKSTALLLGPMLAGVTLTWLIAAGHQRDRQRWLIKMGGLAAVGLISVAVFFALWPAMWRQPGQALSLTFGKLFVDQEAGTGNLGLFWLGRFVEDPGPAFYPVAFILKSTPWLLIGLILSLYLIGLLVISKDQSKSRHSQFAISVSLWVFALIYLILMTIASKKSIRYMLPAFPVFYLLAGGAICEGIERWKKQWKAGQISLSPNLQAPTWPIALLIALAVLLAVPYHPYYFSYYNPVLLGWRWAPDTLLVGWGEGLDQAADYLNRQPPLTVSAWYDWLFAVYYSGAVEAVVPQENLLTTERAVLYINQVQRDIPSPNIIHYFQTRRRPEQTVRLAGIDYAWVYPGPIVGLDRPDPAPQYPLGGEFGGEARLLGYDLYRQAQSGEPLIVTLYWRVLAQPAADRFVYLRLVDAHGHIWAETDSPPVMGLWPVTRWQPGMLIEDAQEIVIPVGTPPGSYRLEVGVYDPDSGQVLAASGQAVGQGGGLLLEAVDVTWQTRTDLRPLPKVVDRRLAPNARLLGYSSLPDTATTGDVLSLELGWQEAARPGSRFVHIPHDFVLFEWRDLRGQRVGEQIDPLPLPVAEWGRRAGLRSQHDLIVPPTLSDGRYDLWLMLHSGSDPAGEAIRLAAMTITAPPHYFELPAQAIPLTGEQVQLDQNVSLLGFRGQPDAQSLAVEFYWQTDKALTTRYKVFAQLLLTDNTMVAQSDSVPGAGTRPTTGWLPGEIIADRHILTLPPNTSPGPYRLIAGLYDPVTGRRLALRDADGTAVADFITVIPEVTLP